MSEESPLLEGGGEDTPLVQKEGGGEVPAYHKADTGVTWRWSEPGIIPTGRLESQDGSTHTTDEVFNSASHLFGAMAAVLGTAVLVTGAAETGDTWAIASFAAYGVTLIGVFVSSFAMHGLDCGKSCNRILRLVDYLMIYYLIAGTATPVCLVCLSDSMYGWVFFGTLWLLALVGTLLQVLFRFPKWGSTTMFLTMGWFGGFLAVPAFPCVGFNGTVFFAAGGLAYTIGAVFFALEKPNPYPGTFGHHEIWHLCVLLGAACHWIVMFISLLPRALEQAHGDENFTHPGW
eukprot:Hpha_TRINITY_DN6095_c0_g1::TRINITY_DN6095_c0_g1_i1::g.63406::m.63406/K11068/hlyIII; hemolysin III